jgi:hypothetical protein
VAPPPPSAGPTPEEIASAKPVAPPPPTAAEVASAKPVNEAPPSQEEVASAKKFFDADEVSKTPVMDLAKDREFDPVQWAAQHPDDAIKPEVLRSLREVYRQHNIQGVTLSDLGEGALKIPSAVGSLAKGVGARAKNLWDIYLPFSSKEQGEKAAAESAAATESAVFGMGKMVKGAVSKLAHGEGWTTGGVRTPWSQMSDSDLNENFFNAVEDAKQSSAIASGQGEMMKHAAYSPELLARDGIHVDPANVEALSLTDPVTLAAFEGGFKVVNAATGKVLATAASMPAAQKAITAVKSAAAATARQAVGQPMRAAGAVATGAGKLAEKAGGAGLTVAALKAAEGEFKQAAAIAGASVAAPALKAAGKGLTEAGENIISGAPLSTGVRRVTDLAGAAGGALSDIGKGATVGGLTALATSQSPEETEGLVSMGGAFALPHAAKGALGHVVAGEMVAPVGQGPKGPVPYRPYGENTVLDRTTADALAQLPPERQGQINFIRQLVQKLNPANRVYVYPDAAAGKSIIADAHASAGSPISDAAAEHAANQNGFSTQLVGPDGKTQNVVFLNAGSGDALGHEVFHLLEKSLPPETLTAMDKQTRSQFSNDEWEGLGKNYTSLLLKDSARPLQEGEDWRTRLAETTPLDPDTAIARENRAENFDQLWHNRGVDIGTPEDAYRKIVGGIGRAAEAVGAPLVQGRTYLGHPLDLRSQQTSEKALGAVLPKEAAPANAPVVRPKAVPGIPATPEAVQTAADNARTIAAAAPETPPAVGGTQSAREILGMVAEAIAKRTGIKINYLSAPDEPAAATTSNRDTRRAMIEAYRTMPPASRSLWEKSFFPEQVTVMKNGGYQVQGWSPEVFAANAHKLAKTLNAIGDPTMSPYELDPKTGSFSEGGWRQLYDDAQAFVKNQTTGKTGAGESLEVPAELQKKGFFKPPVKGPGQPLDQGRADVLNALFGFKLPETPRMQKGKTPLNIAGQEVSAATQPGRVEYPVRPRGEFKGPEAQAQGIEGRPILEVNPFRNKLEVAAKAAGVEAPSFIEAIQKLNLDSIKEVQHAPEQPEFRGNTLTLSAGFQPSIGDLENMTTDEWMKYSKSNPKGYTDSAFQLGLGVKSRAEVAELRAAQARMHDKFAEARAGGDFTEMMSLANKGQFFREAAEAAEGTGSAGDALRKQNPDFKAPFPPESAGQAQPSVHDEPDSIARPAVKASSGKVYLGDEGHWQGTKKAHDAGEDTNKLTFGFTDNAGKFYDRKQAYKQAVRMGQITGEEYTPRPGELETTAFQHIKSGINNSFQFQPVASPDVQKIAEGYAQDAGIPYRPATSYAALNPELSKRLSDFYDMAKHDPTNPEVEKSYDALAKETVSQYKAIKAAGYTLEPFKGEGEPYKNSAEMLADVRDNKHLYFLQTAKQGDLGADNHLMKPSGVDNLPVNDVFRAVHDFFGHAKEGYQFGPRGEFNAWKAHAGMYSDEAQGALAAETLAQNSWVNFGPNAHLPMAERPFGEQKNTVVPAPLREEAAGQAQPETEREILDRELGPAYDRSTVINRYTDILQHEDSMHYRGGLSTQEKKNKAFLERVLRSLPPAKLTGEQQAEYAKLKELQTRGLRHEWDGFTHGQEQRLKTMELGYGIKPEPSFVEEYKKSPTVKVGEPEGLTKVNTPEYESAWVMPNGDAYEVRVEGTKFYHDDAVNGFSEFFKSGGVPNVDEFQAKSGAMRVAIHDSDREIDENGGSAGVSVSHVPTESQLKYLRRVLSATRAEDADEAAITHIGVDITDEKGTVHASKSFENLGKMTAGQIARFLRDPFTGQAQPEAQAQPEGQSQPESERDKLLPGELVQGAGANAGATQRRRETRPVEGRAPEETFSQAQPVNKDKLLPYTAEGVSKAWIVPGGKIEQLGGMYHAQWLSEDPDGILAAKRFRINVPPFEGVDTPGVREAALKKGFVRINSDDKGLTTVESLADKWDKQKDAVERFVEANLGKIDRLKVSLLNPAADAILSSKTVPFFQMDSDREKMNSIPFMFETPKVTVKATELPTFKAPGEAEETLPPAYKGPPKFSLFDGAGQYLGEVDKLQDAIDEAKRIGGSWKLSKKTDTGQAQPFSDNAFDEEIQKLRSGESGGQTFNADGSKWLPPVEKSDIVTLASVNMNPKDLTKDNVIKATAPYADLLEDPSIKLGMFSFSKDGKPTVSVDINAVVPQKHRDNSFKFAKENDQVSFWDAAKNEEVVTGGKGNTKLKTPGEIEDALDDLLEGNPIDIPEILRQNRDESAPPAEADLFGNKSVLSTRQMSEMTKAQIAAHFPEAVIPRRRNKPIPSEITDSPLYKAAGDEEAAVKAFSRKLVDFAKEHNDNPSFHEGAKWYSDFVPMLKKTFGKDSGLMAELLAATSPQNAPESNYAYAVDALEGIKSGRFEKMRVKFEEGLDKIKDGSWLKWYNKELAAGNVAKPPKEPTTAAFLERWNAKHNLVPLQSNGKRYGISSGAVLRVIARKWLGGSGLKTQNFVKNLLGTGHDATIDLWADRTMRRVGYAGFKDRWRILPKNAQGVSDPDFMFSQKAFRDAAKQLGMTADALQGALWFAEKSLWADKGWSRLDLGDYRKEVPKTEALRAGVRERTTRVKAEARTKAMETPEMDLLSPRPVRE